PVLPAHGREESAETDVTRSHHARAEGHIFKSPPAKIPVERVPPGEAAKKNVRPAVSIEVTDSDTAPVFQNAVGGAGPFVQNIGEIDSGLPRRQLCKSGFPLFGDGQLSPLHVAVSVPTGLP